MALRRGSHWGGRPAEAGVGGLQREQRGLHVAGELELLGGDGTACSTSASTRSSRVRENSWYIASRATCWPWDSAGGRRGRRPCPAGPGGFPGPAGRGRGLLGDRVAVGEAAGQFFLEVGQAAAGFDPLPAEQGQRDGGDDGGRTTPGGRGAAAGRGLDGREAGISLLMGGV
jgi:hypothetical protein